MIPVRIQSLGLDATSQQPIVVLREEAGLRVLPIWIGHPEATAILIAVEEVSLPRPMTHDLMLGVLSSADMILERVEVTRVEDGTYYAALIIRGEERTLAVDARPSDSIALAVRARCPILVAEDVMDAAGLIPEDDAEHEVEVFRDFLAHVEPEDFGHS